MLPFRKKEMLERDKKLSGVIIDDSYRIVGLARRTLFDAVFCGGGSFRRPIVCLKTKKDTCSAYKVIEEIVSTDDSVLSVTTLRDVNGSVSFDITSKVQTDKAIVTVIYNKKEKYEERNR